MADHFSCSPLMIFIVVVFLLIVEQLHDEIKGPFHTGHSPEILAHVGTVGTMGSDIIKGS